VENVAVRPPSYKEHTAVEGQSYTIPCDTAVIGDVKWIFTSSVTGFTLTVYDYTVLFERFQSRFSLNTSVPLLYGLDISNVQLNDAGNYTCIAGHPHIHHLIVQGKWRPR